MCNFLTTVIHAAPVPRLIFLERWSHAEEQQKQKSMLKQVTEALENEESRRHTLDLELESCKSIGRRFVNIMSREARNRSRIVSSGGVGGNAGGAGGGAAKKDLFKDDAEADKTNATILRLAEKARDATEEEFIEAATSFLNVLEQE